MPTILANDRTEVAAFVFATYLHAICISLAIFCLIYFFANKKSNHLIRYLPVPYFLLLFCLHLVALMNDVFTYLSVISNYQQGILASICDLLQAWLVIASCTNYFLHLIQQHHLIVPETAQWPYLLQSPFTTLGIYMIHFGWIILLWTVFFMLFLTEFLTNWNDIVMYVAYGLLWMHMVLFALALIANLIVHKQWQKMLQLVKQEYKQLVALALVLLCSIVDCIMFSIDDDGNFWYLPAPLRIFAYFNQLCLYMAMSCSFGGLLQVLAK